MKLKVFLIGLALWSAALFGAGCFVSGKAASGVCDYYPGWNLVTRSGSVNALPDCISVAWRYDSATDTWSFYGRDNDPSFNTLDHFQLGDGYWLYRDK